MGAALRATLYARPHQVLHAFASTGKVLNSGEVRPLFFNSFGSEKLLLKLMNLLLHLNKKWAFLSELLLNWLASFVSVHYLSASFLKPIAQWKFCFLLAQLHFSPFSETCRYKKVTASNQNLIHSLPNIAQPTLNCKIRRKIGWKTTKKYLKMVKYGQKLQHLKMQ